MPTIQIKENDLPNIRWHDLRHSYATLLLKNDFNLKAISKLLGHSKEIVTADNYIDNSAIIADGVEELRDYIDEVLPEDSYSYIEGQRIFDLSGIETYDAFVGLIG